MLLSTNKIGPKIENICDHVLEGGPGIGSDGGYGQYVAVER